MEQHASAEQNQHTSAFGDKKAWIKNRNDPRSPATPKLEQGGAEGRAAHHTTGGRVFLRLDEGKICYDWLK
jgi:hypothetical protein